MTVNRRKILLEFLDQNPNDSFARYGLAMLEAQENHADEALRQFDILLERNPDYTAAYQQKGQLLIALHRLDEARAVLRAGVAAARREGNDHAQTEISGLLVEIGDE